MNTDFCRSGAPFCFDKFPPRLWHGTHRGDERGFTRMKKHNLGILGYGWAASAHLSAINASPTRPAPTESCFLPTSQRQRSSSLPAKQDPAQLPNHFLVTLLSVALCVAIPGCALTPNYAVKFETKESETNFVVQFAPRVPKALGGEENVYVERITPLGKSRKFKIDHNGRFSRRVRVDSGNGGTWARIYLELESPMVGESVPCGTNESGRTSRVFQDYRTGQTTVSNCYPYNVIALVNFESMFVINGYLANSTAEEWNSRLIGLVRTLPSVQSLRGDTVTWQQTIRSDRRE